jgi:folate-binding protein YgfZ
MSERWISELTDQGAHFADGRIADFGNPASELSAVNGGTVLCDLSHDGLILVSGDDAASYLQAQFCNDVLSLGDGIAQWNGWCSPKGRLLATFLVWKGRQGFFLQLPRSLQAAVQKRMRMFVLRAKVALSDESANWVRFGVAGAEAESMIKAIAGQVPESSMSTLHVDGGRVLRLSANRFEIVAGVDIALAWWRELSRKATCVGAPVWDGLNIRDGILTVLPNTQDLFVPQMANFELIGGVSFKKGCYPGQEIVARTQYRGILKRRMALVHSTAAAVPNPGDSVYAQEFADQAAGTIANAAPAPGGGFDALVVAQIEALKGGSLALTFLDGPKLIVKSLPYVVPELADPA